MSKRHRIFTRNGFKKEFAPCFLSPRDPRSTPGEDTVQIFSRPLSQPHPSPHRHFRLHLMCFLRFLGITLFSVPHEDIEEEEEKEDEEEYDTENNESVENTPKRLTRNISRNCNITASEILEDEEYGRVTSKGDAADATQTTFDHYRTKKYDGGGEGGVEEVEEGKEEREGKEDGICESGANFSSNSENASLGESGGDTIVEKDNFAQDTESDTEDSVTSVPPPVDQLEVVTKDQSNTIIFDALNQLIRIVL